MSEIILTTLNARYSHSAFGLRYLFANLGELQSRAMLLEFTIKQRPIDVVEAIVALEPRVVGIGVYIWNAEISRRVVSLLKRVRPDVVVVIGGPEVSHEWQGQAVVDEADYLITGEGDLAFAALCRELLAGTPPATPVIDGGLPDLSAMALPYAHYDDDDVAHRVIYVEASRGCPFRCEFCLSSLDKQVRAVPLAPFLDAMDDLLNRGARRFKFVDRTFNLDEKTSLAIVEHFLSRYEPGMFLHFEMIPDRLPSSLREAIRRFPPGALQFEVGIQTFSPEVGRRIRRRQKNDVAEANLRWLAEETGVHVHADLIVGLPGESVAGFGRGFDRLVAAGPDEIQVGILKRLRGTTLDRHEEEWGMVYSPDPPYEVLQTGSVDFANMQRMKRFARYWDLVANSGNFVRTAPLLWADGSPFEAFLAFSEWLFARLGGTGDIGLDRLAEALLDYLTECLERPDEEVGPILWRDYRLDGRRKRVPRFLKPYHEASAEAAGPAEGGITRQDRHRVGRESG